MKDQPNKSKKPKNQPKVKIPLPFEQAVMGLLAVKPKKKDDTKK